jgi:histidinol-phosphatase
MTALPVADLSADLALALQLAAHADAVARAEMAAGVGTRTKPDGTPVTNVDLAVDGALVAALRAARPDDAILSEESGLHDGIGSRGWILDPVDGTFNLVRGHAHWGIHIALEVDGAIVVGVVTRPMLDARWWATRGGGAFRSVGDGSPERLAVSTRTELATAQIRLWNDDAEHAAWIRSATVWTDADMNDILGVAEGRCDAVIGSPGEIWDHAPTRLLVEEAGGRFRDDRGGDRIDGGRGHFTNGVIDAALDALLAG